MDNEVSIESPNHRFVSQWRREWFGNIGKDLLSGLLIAVALIPESIGYSIVAGVNPIVGLYGAIIIVLIASFFGGRTGMVSAATGAMAMVLVLLIRTYGVEYMFPATCMAGIIQVLMGFMHVGNLLKFIPKPVMLGFVNALAIMIFRTQMQYFSGAEISMFTLTAAGLIMMYGFPLLTKKIPSGLITLVILSTFAIFSGIEYTRISDMGDISGGLPTLHAFMVPLNMETVNIIMPYSISLAVVGVTEAMLTSRIIDEKVGNGSNKNKESIAQGLGNIVSSLFGGMAGCAMLGQSMVNINAGGRGRLSTFTAGIGLLFLVVVLTPLVNKIPVAALVSIMITVAISTFDWDSIRRVTKVAKSDTVTMLTTMLIVLATNNLAYGVLLGVVVSTLIYTGKASNTSLEVMKIFENGTAKLYCTGDLFFASADAFLDETFIHNERVDMPYSKVVIDATHLYIRDETAVDALDKVVKQFLNQGLDVTIIGMKEEREHFYTKMSRVYGTSLEDCLHTTQTPQVLTPKAQSVL